jgi:hypothetical protein
VSSCTASGVHAFNGKVAANYSLIDRTDNHRELTALVLLGDEIRSGDDAEMDQSMRGGGHERRQKRRE